MTVTWWRRFMKRTVSVKEEENQNDAKQRNARPLISLRLISSFILLSSLQFLGPVKESGWQYMTFILSPVKTNACGPIRLFSWFVFWILTIYFIILPTLATELGTCAKRVINEEKTWLIKGFWIKESIFVSVMQLSFILILLSSFAIVTFTFKYPPHRCLASLTKKKIHLRKMAAGCVCPSFVRCSLCPVLVSGVITSKVKRTCLAGDWKLLTRSVNSDINTHSYLACETGGLQLGVKDLKTPLEFDNL